MSTNATSNSQHVRGVAIAASGTLIVSFDAVLVRLADAAEWDVVFWRGMLIFLSLLVYQIVRGKRPRPPASRGEAVATLAVALIFGVNTALFVISVSNTLAANTVVILSSAPFFAALFSRFFLRERVRPRTWAAIIVAVAGVLVVFGGSLGLGTSYGDLCAIVMALLMGASLTTLRRYPGIDRIPVVCASGLVAGLIAWPLAAPFSLDTSSYAALAVMGLVQMPVAMVLIATATRYLPSPEVGLFLLIETVLGPVWVWLAVGEQPPSLTFIGGMAILGAVAVHSWLTLRESRDWRRADTPAAAGASLGRHRERLSNDE